MYMWALLEIFSRTILCVVIRFRIHDYWPIEISKCCLLNEMGQIVPREIIPLSWHLTKTLFYYPYKTCRKEYQSCGEIIFPPKNRHTDYVMPTSAFKKPPRVLFKTTRTFLEQAFLTNDTLNILDLHTSKIWKLKRIEEIANLLRHCEFVSNEFLYLFHYTRLKLFNNYGDELLFKNLSFEIFSGYISIQLFRFLHIYLSIYLSQYIHNHFLGLFTTYLSIYHILFTYTYLKLPVSSYIPISIDLCCSLFLSLSLSLPLSLYIYIYYVNI